MLYLVFRGVKGSARSNSTLVEEYLRTIPGRDIPERLPDLARHSSCGDALV
jgi:hypothetical protein